MHKAPSFNKQCNNQHSLLPQTAMHGVQLRLSHVAALHIKVSLEEMSYLQRYILAAHKWENLQIIHVHPLGRWELAISPDLVDSRGPLWQIDRINSQLESSIDEMGGKCNLQVALGPRAMNFQVTVLFVKQLSSEFLTSDLMLKRPINISVRWDSVSSAKSATIILQAWFKSLGSTQQTQY